MKMSAKSTVGVRPYSLQIHIQSASPELCGMLNKNLARYSLSNSEGYQDAQHAHPYLGLSMKGRRRVTPTAVPTRMTAAAGSVRRHGGHAGQGGT